MPLTSKLPLGLALLLWVTLAAGQNTLGELLDAGARRISVEEFRRDLVGRSLAGNMSASTELEMVYAGDGTLRGYGSKRQGRPFSGYELGSISGSWTTGDSDTICITMNVGRVAISNRCQFWFKLGEEYFISDYESDRSARVIRRTVTKR
jgi:hypothetical protein